MESRKSVVDIIKQRTSIRTYIPKPIDPKKKEELINLLKSEIDSPFETKIRFELLEMDSKNNVNGKKMGTYGMIKGANTYIIGITNKSNKNIEHYGYIFEKMILLITSLGLGTCWLGGTFNRSNVGDMITLLENEFIPAITPVGNSHKKRRKFESLLRTSIGANNRKSWNQLFFYKDFDNELSIKEAGVYKTPLEMLRLAPSASNKQPWRILKDDAYYHFYLSRNAGYGKILPYDIQCLDIGIAMCHFDLTSKEQGLSGKWILENPGYKTPNDETLYVISWQY